MRKPAPLILAAIASYLLFIAPLEAQPAAPPAKAPHKLKIILDTDIGDDIDDAFAVAMALRSPEFEILGITTAFQNTQLRAQIVDRMLGEAGRTDIPVAAGVTTPGDSLTQRKYAVGGHFVRDKHPSAIDFILEQIRRYPGQITLVAIGPLTNVGAVIDRDPQTFRKLQRVVIMGGWVKPLKDDYGNSPPQEPQPEWNIVNDIHGAQKLFTSGLPLYVMPIDSTGLLLLDDVKREAIFAHGTPLTDALTLLYHQWSAGRPGSTPVLFDAMTLAYLLDPKLCPVEPMHIRVDDKGLTRAEQGPANAQVCLHSDPDTLMQFYLHRLLAP